jgi:hypothetical protein
MLCSVDLACETDFMKATDGEVEGYGSVFSS